MWGRSFDVDPTEKFAHAENLVHIEACPRTGGSGRCPLPAGASTFYGRFRAVAGGDRREPLPTTFASSYFDERENPTDLCFSGDNVLPVPAGRRRGSRR